MMKNALKTLIITIIIGIIGVNYSSAAMLILPDGWEKMTETAYTRRYNKIDDDERMKKLSTLRTRLDLLSSQTSDSNLQLFLSFVGALASESITIQQEDNNNSESNIDDNQDKQITGNDQDDPTKDQKYEQLTLSSFNSDFLEDTPLFLLAGSRAQTIGKFEISAIREPIVLEELVLTATTDIRNHIESFYLVDEDGTIISKTFSFSSQNREAKFRNVGYELQQKGSTDLYVVVDLSPVGDNFSATQGTRFGYTLSVEEARGVFSGEKISISSFDRSDNITVGSMMITDIRSVESAYGYRVDNVLTTGENTLMIVEIDAEGGVNQQTDSPRSTEMILSKLTFEVQDSTAGRDVIDSITLERIDTPTSPVSPSSIDGDRAIFSNLSTESKFASIRSGTTATYLVRANVTLGSQGGEAVDVTLEDLDNGGIGWKEESGTITYTSLENGIRRVEGKRISD